MENMKIKEWYTKEYASDDLGEELNENITFMDLFETLDRHKDVYELIGVSDSIVRERLFEKLAEIMEVDYDYIYEQWIGVY